VLARFLRSESGATAIEYGLIMTLIAIAIIGVLIALGSNISNVLWNRISNQLSSA
jgi:pilus assembly protein Flp/PilA